MSVGRSLAIGSAAAALMLLGCSSSQPRDINYGTDVGLDFTPPDGGSLKDGLAQESGGSVDGSLNEAGVDESQDSALSDFDVSSTVEGE
jgi:hypothetical protein